MADDLDLVASAPRQFLKCARIVLRTSLGKSVLKILGLLGAHLRSPTPADCGEIQQRIPDGEITHIRKFAHRAPILTHRRQDDRLTLCALEVALTSDDLETGGETLHVPFPRAEQC